MQTRPAVCLAVLAAALALTAGPSLAQTTAPDAPLQAKGETYHRAPDAAQNPVELTATQRLNAEVAAQNAVADRHDAVAEARSAADDAAYQADRARYREDVAATATENADRAAESRTRAAFNADQLSRYDKAMADWRATMRACETGDTARCRAGQQRPIATDF